ncbi:MAG: aldehyde dehydrogenase family protein [SAR86 cluster bacterium]|jgi:aldehyde dehydrogenase (NAD+)|nr:MAG: aldehyde dehydrogenase family protein [SAR86 cluster bacterium]URQ69268.1 aldehyde dehydrogenase family protein [SAR86 cluster bacterium]|tara:strand:+ start:810 stop:2237 length:1428 start_codon:yes stop_codon:yes gene_type:complete
MRDELNFYINGEWVESDSSETIEVVNPANEEIIGHVTAGSKQDINSAVKAANEAFKSFGQTTKKERIEYLEAIIKEYENRYQDFVETITLEMGAPTWLSNRAQASTGIKNFNETLDALKIYEFEKPEGDYLLRKEPIGVIGMITPWNWPMNQITTKVSAAIASGCTMILKPSEISPYCAMLLAEVIDKAGLPKGVFNLVNGYGPIVGAALSEHVNVDMMSITGSTRAGIAVAQASAASVKRVSQELGGKSANIILDSVADLEKSVKGGVGHCFLNSGQSCNAPTRLLVSEKNYEKAVEVAVEVANSTTVGDPNGEYRIGPISNRTQYEKIIRMIEIGIEEGAKLVAGGIDKPDGYEKGFYVKPTVFADVTNDMTIAQEEIFGPVLCIIKYNTEDEAINIANDSEYGLAGYVQGELSHAQEVGRKIRAGQITINGGARGTGAPFGGYKTSGNGREHGVHGMEDFLETKALIFPQAS